MKPRIPAPGYIAIECSTCDPPSVVHVRVDAEITLPYSCTVCIKRGLRRLENREQPLVGEDEAWGEFRNDEMKVMERDVENDSTTKAG